MYSPAVYVHTVRHLRREQILGQIHHRIRRWLERPERLLRRPIPEFPGAVFTGDAAGLAEYQPPPAVTGPDQGDWTFLNESHAIGWPPDWNFRGASRLWRYQLHYFNDIWRLPFESCRELVLDWIGRHPPARTMTGWEPYPVSVRLMNWIGVLFGLYADRCTADHGFVHAVWPSVYRQVEWLTDHLETHILGNHLLENAAALTIAGSVFQGSDAKIWRSMGIRLLHREIPEQMLPDGMHFERSPMYHARILYLMIYIHRVADPEVQAWLAPWIERAAAALDLLRHPDGGMALFNDCAFNMYGDPPVTREYFGSFQLPSAGYFGHRDELGNAVICDAGPVGPDYIPGHAHGDMLSFELSLRGHRVIVDSGVYDYEPGEMRRYCRSTQAHNTVEINGEDQCRFWSAFRMAERGRPFDVRWEQTPGGFLLSAGHDGYRRLPGAPVHSRSLDYSGDGRLAVTDTVTAGSPVTAVSRIHLHPACEIRGVTDNEVTVGFPAGEFRLAFTGSGRLRIESGWYCPEFGRRTEIPVPAYEFDESPGRTSFLVELS